MSQYFNSIYVQEHDNKINKWNNIFGDQTINCIKCVELISLFE